MKCALLLADRFASNHEGRYTCVPKGGVDCAEKFINLRSTRARLFRINPQASKLTVPLLVGEGSVYIIGAPAKTVEIGDDVELHCVAPGEFAACALGLS